MTALDIARAAHLAELRRALEAGHDHEACEDLIITWREGWYLVRVARDAKA